MLVLLQRARHPETETHSVLTWESAGGTRVRPPNLRMCWLAAVDAVAGVASRRGIVGDPGHGIGAYPGTVAGWCCPHRIAGGVRSGGRAVERSGAAPGGGESQKPCNSPRKPLMACSPRQKGAFDLGW